MEKFTLEAAQQGKPLITRDGRPARYVAVMQKSNPQFPVVVEVFKFTEDEALQEAETGGNLKRFDSFYKKLLLDNANWHMENFTIDGEILSPFEQPEDLFIQSL